jgi:DNA end-binding protein Ku
MARAMWSGVLAFGLVNVPVGLFSSTVDRQMRFNQIHKGTANRIRYRKVDEVTGEEVSNEDIVSGYDTGEGEYVVVDREELKAAAPGRSELMEISDFVDISDIDPKFFRQSYYLAPRGKGADRAYALLRAAMQETGQAGVATVVLRDREHLVVVRAAGDALVVESLFFADEIRDASEVVGELPDDGSFADRELAIAKQLIDSLRVDWEPERYRDTYRERVEALIDEKRKTGSVAAISEDKPRTNVIDLMAALEESVAARTGRAGTKAGSKSATKPAKTAKAATAAKPAKRGKAATPDLAELSKADLLSQAGELDIKGRSSMTKDELIEAIESVPARQRSAAS